MMATESRKNLPVIFLMGPTASGKTQIASELVQQLPVDIISVDSAMVYRGLDIGTAKPSEDILNIAPHRLINICDPVDIYSAGNFVCDAKREIEAIQSKGRIPLLVGGTGLYFRSLEQGFSPLPEANPAIRARLNEELNEKGLASLYSRLLSVDPQSESRIHKNDPQRIQRALEIYEETGKPASSWYSQGRVNCIESPVIKLVIAPNNKDQLHNTIEVRFMKMLDRGLVEEVKGLQKQNNLHVDLPSMRLVGYRQVCSYLDGELSYKQMINKGIIATRQLAKRQYTWLRREENAHWVDSEMTQMSQYLRNYIESRALYNFT